MSEIIAAIEREQLKTNLPSFSAGDTVAVHLKVKEGNRERIQIFEGIVIAEKRNQDKNFNAAFTVRKISNGEGVERTFQTHSPLIADIEVKRRGKVRKSKLYHLRELSGRAARIKEKIDTKGKNKAEAKETDKE